MSSRVCMVLLRQLGMIARDTLVRTHYTFLKAKGPISFHYEQIMFERCLYSAVNIICRIYRTIVSGSIKTEPCTL